MAAFTPQAPLAGEPIIIDTDPGVDDALALVFACAAGMHVEGITIVHGNGSDVKQVGLGVPARH
jgi:inosine-uridine nucleoside N-ribohydrolase